MCNCLCVLLFLLLLVMMDLLVVLVDLCLSYLYWPLPQLCYATIFLSCQNTIFTATVTTWAIILWVSSLLLTHPYLGLTSVSCARLFGTGCSLLLFLLILWHKFSLSDNLLCVDFDLVHVWLSVCVYWYHSLCYDSLAHHSSYLCLALWAPALHVLQSMYLPVHYISWPPVMHLSLLSPQVLFCWDRRWLHMPLCSHDNSSHLCNHFIYTAQIAQFVEQWTIMWQVLGSIPAPNSTWLGVDSALHPFMGR